MMFVNSGWAHLFTIDVVKLSDEEVIAISKDIYRHIEHVYDSIDKVDNIFLEIKRAKNQKHKDRDTLNKIGFIRTRVKYMRDALMTDHAANLQTHKIAELVPFIDENIWLIPVLDYNKDSKKEDIFILPIAEIINQKDSIFGFDRDVEKWLTYSLLDSPENTGFDFIKIPLWDIPFTQGMAFEKLKYTRENLQPALLSFNIHLRELSESIFPLSFTPENILVIKQLCNEKLSEHFAPVQQSIYDSLYIQQLLNQSPDIAKLKLCLGIASAETLINYYERITLVLPYVISQIKQQTARHTDLNASYMFTYLELPEEIIAIIKRKK